MAKESSFFISDKQVEPNTYFNDTWRRKDFFLIFVKIFWKMRVSKNQSKIKVPMNKGEVFKQLASFENF